MRGGTDNMPYIMGFAKACELLDGNESYIAGLRDSFEQILLQKIPDIRINGNLEQRVCSISNITFRGIDAEMLIGYLPDLCFSLGSACTSGSEEPSHVLTAVGMAAEEAKSTVRFSFSRYNTMDEIDRASEMLHSAVIKLRK